MGILQLSQKILLKITPNDLHEIQILTSTRDKLAVINTGFK